MTGRLVASGMATYLDLSSVLSLEDAYLIDEALTVRQYHDWLAAKQDAK